MAHDTLPPRLPLASVVLTLALAACGRLKHHDTPHHTDVLIVCPGAEAVYWRWFEGTDQLGYQVKMEYPADSLISLISKTLNERGWPAIEGGFLESGSSLVRGQRLDAVH